ncbi:MAG TPA: hypothetical protein VKX30_09055 [Flavobacteriaceae bacterium]|nr:hypothetical protein [Flavobacteriaceae bacterium]
MLRIIKCDSACTICDKAQYNEASFRDKLCLALHLVFCKTCRDYVRNNRKLTQHVDSKMKRLNAEAKAKMQQDIDSELNKSTNM